MLYIDTSVIVSMLTNEEAAPAITRWFGLLDQTPQSSDWLMTEFASALALKVRTGQIQAKQKKWINRSFETLLAGGLRIAPVSRAAFHLAARFLDNSNGSLRAGDALHLAVARELAATTFVTLDQRQAICAATNGFDVLNPSISV